jgi:hypothetical protein
VLQLPVHYSFSQATGPPSPSNLRASATLIHIWALWGQQISATHSHSRGMMEPPKWTWSCDRYKSLTLSQGLPLSASLNHVTRQPNRPCAATPYICLCAGWSERKKPCFIKYTYSPTNYSYSISELIYFPTSKKCEKPMSEVYWSNYEVRPSVIFGKTYFTS